MEVIVILLIVAGFGGLMLMLVSCGIEFLQDLRESQVWSIGMMATCISIVLAFSFVGLVLTAINHL